ncbi:MAG: DNA-binding GntR family transcriptional regulator [Cocleimonas sp.]|jgi:DNA-binding GntR family transcriptional regulator
MPIQKLNTRKDTKGFESVETKTLSEQVFNELKDAIIAGDLEQGSKITEDGLAKQYGISRGPLREAIRRLEAIRLLVRIPHAGMRVVTLTTEIMEEIYTVREALEGMSARLAAQRMSDDDITSLSVLLDKHQNSIDESQGKHYLQHEGNLDFHFRIASASNNQWLIDLLSSELYQLLRMCRQRSGQTPARPSKAIQEHRSIVEAIQTRDPELAELLMRRHISGAWKIVKELLDKEEAEDQSEQVKHIEEQA